MADEKLEKTSQHLNKADDAEQQQEHLNSNAENSTSNNFGQFGYIPEDVRKIYIGGLNDEITEKDLSEHFGQFGEIKYTDVKVNTANGQNKGYAFVVFKTLEGTNNALACNNHVINDIKIEPKKAIPRRVKLFVGGLSPNLTDEDIINYFKRYTHDVKAEMPFDKVKNKRKRFCFVTIENLEAVTEILRLPRHVIKEKQVDVKVAEMKRNNFVMIDSAFKLPIRMQSNVLGQGGFLPRLGYGLYAPGYHYRGNGYYVPYTGFFPNFYHNYAYPSYVAGARADNQPEGNETSAPSGVNRNQIVEYPNNYHNYGYPSYVAGARADNQPEGNETSAPSGVKGNQIMELPNNYHNYGYPSYVAEAEAGNQSEGNETSAPSGVNGNQIVE